MKKKTTKQLKPKKRDATITAVVEQPFMVKGPTKSTVLQEHEWIECKSISFQGPNLVIEPLNTTKKGFKFAVPANMVKVYIGRLPDYRLDMSFVEFGYQADHYVNVDQKNPYMQPTSTTCRDFGGNYPIDKLVERFQQFAERAILSFKKKL